MRVARKIVRISMSDDVDIFKIGAWLDSKGILKQNSDVRRKWWYHAIICFLVQAYLVIRINSISLNESTLSLPQHFVDDDLYIEFKKSQCSISAQIDQTLAVMFTIAIISRSIFHKLNLIFNKQSNISCT